MFKNINNAVADGTCVWVKMWTGDLEGSNLVETLGIRQMAVIVTRWNEEPIVSLENRIELLKVRERGK